jgi:hypothetical protein
MGDHGRFIPLSEQANIEAFVGYQMGPDWSVTDYETAEVSDLKQERDVEQVEVLGAKWIRLGKIRARRFIVRVTEKGRKVIIDHVIALYKGVEYELILRTLSARYLNDEQKFKKVIASWRLTPRL